MSAVRTLLRSAPRIAALRAPLLRQARTYATEAPAAKGSNALLFGALGAAALGGAGYFALSGESDPTAIKDAASPKEVDYQA